MWVAFALVHLTVALLGFILPNQAMGDVYLVYEPWSGCALFGTSNYCGAGGHEIVGLTSIWVYPQLALVPMLAAWAFAWIDGYIVAWAIVVTLVDAAAFAILLGRGRSAGRRSAAWFWLAFILLLGPVGMYRLEGITVPLAIVGSLWLVRRPWLGSVLLSIATWMKVWPAAVIAAALIVVRRRLAVVGGALVVSAAILGVVFAFGGGKYAFGFIGDQAGRGLQIEAPVSAYYLWRAISGSRDAWIYYDTDMLTYQATGPNVDAVIALMTPLMALAVVGVALLGAWKVRRGAGFATVFPALSLALVLAVIVFNKVGSPQYIAWIAAPVVVGLVIRRARWRGPAIGLLAIAAITQLVYPILYNLVLALDPVAVGLLTLRNVLLIALFAWSVVALAKASTAPELRLRRVAASGLISAD
nr:hypothetical protein [Microbacterium endophyticum]